MPTPRPIIVASVGATVGTALTCPTAVIRASVVKRPRMAVMIGSAIAVAVPKASRRMITAAASPTASLLSVDGPRELLADVAADRGLEAGLRGRVGGVQDPLGLGRRRVARADVERDRDVAGLAVLAEQRRGALVERAHDAGDVGHRLQVLDGGVDRARARRVTQGAAVIEQRERDAPVRLLGQFLLEQVGGARRSGAGKRQIVVPLLPERGRPQVQPDGDDEPDGDHAPSAGAQHMRPTQ